ncbi:hypothetical protein [Spirosoma panaciterrae]|uniref:hypothetical protein n=1 Tax=Spirosoma panaciterrae TaxID=496058 RepID=UPI00035C648E|nr:hypothetical protein [Spirosoma panaciterrae]
MTPLLRTVLRVLFFPISLLFIRCSNSSLSTGAVVEPSLLRVNVNFYQSVDEDGERTERVEAYVKDANDRSVANPDIHLKVDGRKLRLTTGSTNYYSTYAYYTLADTSWHIDAAKAYPVSIVLTDGKEYSLGTIQVQPALTPALFLPPKTHSRRRALTLYWQAIESDSWLLRLWKKWQGETTKTELTVSKQYRTVDEWNNVHYEGHSTDVADYLNKQIESGKGAFTIPATYFQRSQNPFNELSLMINSEKQVTLDTPFLKGSSLSSTCKTLYRIEITD